MYKNEIILNIKGLKYVFIFNNKRKYKIVLYLDAHKIFVQSRNLTSLDHGYGYCREALLFILAQNVLIINKLLIIL